MGFDDVGVKETSLDECDDVEHANGDENHKKRKALTVSKI